jgi:tRNA 2-thiouridine synthesizing protein A
MIAAMDAARTIDARGLRCPEPVLALRAALAVMEPGATVALLADDPLAGVDLEAYCLRAGHRLRATTRDGDATRFVVERG